MVAGAWHGGWAWRPVAERLRIAGHEVHTPTMPGLNTGDDPSGIGLDQCYDSLTSYIEDRDLSDIILVSHSWGGFVVCGAAERIVHRLQKLIFWSSFVPEHGTSLMDLVPPESAQLFTDLAATTGNTSILLPLEIWQRAFMQDAGEEAQRIVHSLLVPQPFKTFTDRADQKKFHQLDIPSAYIVGKDDIALPPGKFAWAPRFPRRLKDPLLLETPGSHESLFTRPADLAASIMDATGS